MSYYNHMTDEDLLDALRQIDEDRDNKEISVDASKLNRDYRRIWDELLGRGWDDDDIVVAL